MKIYVAGKLNDGAVDYIKHVHDMMEVAVKLREMGHAPFVPCLDVLLGFMSGKWDYEDYIGCNMPFVEVCDAILMMPSWKDSPGAIRENHEAFMKNVRIYYQIEDVPNEMVPGK